MREREREREKERKRERERDTHRWGAAVEERMLTLAVLDGDCP